MSWMDSWSRPSKHSATPPPLYLTVGEDVPYCHTCGRVMSARMTKPGTKSSTGNAANRKASSPVKYCSDRCRSRKPGPVDRKIEEAILGLLNADSDSGVDKTKAKDRVVKGDHRIVVTVDEIEEIVFGSRFDPKKVFGRRKNRASRALDGGANKEWKSVDMESDRESDYDRSHSSSEDNDDLDLDDGGSRLEVVEDDSSKPDSTAGIDAEMVPLKLGPRIRPPQTESDVNFSVGGERGKAEKIEESPADLEKRSEGQRRAEEREMVRRAARRAVVFGFTVDRQDVEPVHETRPSKRKSKKIEHEISTESENVQAKRKCEALVNGSVVEPSFAKGNWAIRWRE